MGLSRHLCTGQINLLRSSVSCIAIREFMSLRYLVAMLMQKKGNENSSSLVWDLDSSLPIPSSLGSYVAESIRPSIQIFSEFKR